MCVPTHGKLKSYVCDTVKVTRRKTKNYGLSKGGILIRETNLTRRILEKYRPKTKKKFVFCFWLVVLPRVVSRFRFPYGS